MLLSFPLILDVERISSVNLDMGGQAETLSSGMFVNLVLVDIL